MDRRVFCRMLGIKAPVLGYFMLMMRVVFRCRMSNCWAIFWCTGRTRIRCRAASCALITDAKKVLCSTKPTTTCSAEALTGRLPTLYSSWLQLYEYDHMRGNSVIYIPEIKYISRDRLPTLYSSWLLFRFILSTSGH